MAIMPSSASDISAKSEAASLTRISQEFNVREQWTGRLDFLLTCLGYAVGLGNVWRFPYQTYRNGGGAFFIPYLSSLFFMGMPMFLMELSLGQFTSAGPTVCWDFCKLFQGCGFSMAMISALTSTYYNVILSWAIFYLFVSFAPEVPWAKCGDWSTPMCSDRVRFLSVNECLNESGTFASNGTCILPKAPNEVWIVNKTRARENGITAVFPAQEYFMRRAIGAGLGNDITNLGTVRWELVLSLLTAWIIIALCLAKGIKTSGKVSYVTATLPYVALTVLLIRGVALKGAGLGIKYYLTPQLSSVISAQIWKDAAQQIFFSLSTAYGGLIALASYNKFHNDIVRDALVVSIGNSLSSIFAGFVIFSYLGFLATTLHEDISVVATQGPTLAFVIYPYCLTRLPAAPFWSVIFFVMIIILGIGSQMVLVETVITSVVDLRPQLRVKKYKTVLMCCVILFFAGLPMTTNGGIGILDLMDTYSGGWNVLFVAICECIAISYFYGINRYLADVELMIKGQYCAGCDFGFMAKTWWKLNWVFLTPVMAAFVVVFSLVNYKQTHAHLWVDAIGWTITLICVGFIPALAIFNFMTAPGAGSEKWRFVTRPTPYWGPALEEHRRLVQNYVPDLIISFDEEQGERTEMIAEGVKSSEHFAVPQARQASFMEETQII